MAQPPESYQNDHSKMVVQLARPATVRYRKRGSDGWGHLPLAGESAATGEVD